MLVLMLALSPFAGFVVAFLGNVSMDEKRTTVQSAMHVCADSILCTI